MCIRTASEISNAGNTEELIKLLQRSGLPCLGDIRIMVAHIFRRWLCSCTLWGIIVIAPVHFYLLLAYQLRYVFIKLRLYVYDRVFIDEP
jgi:hypothetical protein